MWGRIGVQSPGRRSLPDQPMTQPHWIIKSGRRRGNEEMGRAWAKLTRPSGRWALLSQSTLTQWAEPKLSCAGEVSILSQRRNHQTGCVQGHRHPRRESTTVTNISKHFNPFNMLADASVGLWVFLRGERLLDGSCQAVPGPDWHDKMDSVISQAQGDDHGVLLMYSGTCFFSFPQSHTGLRSETRAQGSQSSANPSIWGTLSSYLRGCGHGWWFAIFLPFPCPVVLISDITSTCDQHDGERPGSEQETTA